MSLIKPNGAPMHLSAAEAFSLSGKVVIVTGAAGNVGSGIAEVFAANHANVVISDRAGEKLTLATDYLSGKYPTISQTPADLTRPDDLKNLVDSTTQRFGRLDAIVNCGAVPTSNRLEKEDIADFDRLFHTNLRSIWLLTKYAVEPMTAASGGSVVNISSVNGHRPLFMCALYAGTKSGVLAMTRELAVELAPQNIRVNSVSPGLIPDTSRRMAWLSDFLTDEYASQLREEFDARLAEALLSAQPLRMSGHGHDIGMACYYLCSPAARFVTGIDITVDGGKLLEMPESEARFWNDSSRKSVDRDIRARLRELPDEAWKNGKPKWFIENRRRDKDEVPRKA